MLQPPTCTDLITNGGETDVDCGGSICQTCPNTRTCAADSDCQSGYCGSRGPCMDGICGDRGVCAPKVSWRRRWETWRGARTGWQAWPDAAGQRMLPRLAHECLLRLALPFGPCAQPPSCTNGIKDGYEADVDCGGKDCQACALGKMCKASTDCLSKHCKGGTCVPQVPGLVQIVGSVCGAVGCEGKRWLQPGRGWKGWHAAGGSPGYSQSSALLISCVAAPHLHRWHPKWW